MTRDFRARATVGAALLATLTLPGEAQEAGATASRALDSLLNTRISAASKYEQTRAEAAASITIVSADDLRAFKFRNLLDVLETVQGFYVSNDRNYQYVGARGFGRPTDYNNRILVLVDGHTINDHTWGGTPVGSDLPIDLNAVERIEIVRGPGSVLYGTSAMFAVVNVVTKTGGELDGVVAGANVASGRAREATLSAGRQLSAQSTAALSGIWSNADGRDLYFPEFDAPTTNFGVARGLDWTKRLGAHGTLTWRDASVRVGYRAYEKGIPTGAYGTAFGDPRSQTRDQTSWAEIAVRRRVDASLGLTLRVFGDHYRYDGVYAFSSGTPYRDRGISTSVGGEAVALWDPSSRDRVTVGVEYRDVRRAGYRELFDDGSTTADDAPFNVISAFAQNDLQITSALRAVSGLRFDRWSTDDRAVTPRFALIATPDEATTIKALYGEAYRAPSAAEARIETSFYSENANLNAERIRSYELGIQRRVSDPLIVGLSVYDYRIRNLIEQVEIQNPGGIQYRNAAGAHAVGIEAESEWRGRGPLSAHVSYAWQRAHDAASEARLSNSPEHVATVSVAANAMAGLRPAVLVRYESGRRTISGASTKAFARTDVTLGYTPRVAMFGDGVTMSLRVTNLFDALYAVPAGVEHAQTALVQDGRAVALRLDWRR